MTDHRLCSHLLSYHHCCCLRRGLEMLILLINNGFNKCDILYAHSISVQIFRSGYFFIQIIFKSFTKKCLVSRYTYKKLCQMNNILLKFCSTCPYILLYVYSLFLCKTSSISEGKSMIQQLKIKPVGQNMLTICNVSVIQSFLS